MASPPFSDMLESDSLSVTLGVSSSVMVSAAPVTAKPPAWLVLAAVPPTDKRLSDSMASLSKAVMVTVPALLRCPAGMVSVVLADSR